MSLKRLARLNPIYWSIIFFVVAQIITFTVITHEEVFLEKNNIYIPPPPADTVSVWPQPTVGPSGEVEQTPVYSSLGPILIYFFSVVIVLGLILFFIPMWLLQKVLRGLFAFLFSWAVFIITIIWIPFPAAVAVAAVVGLGWFFFPKVWLHNIAMVLAMVGVAAVFGKMLSPWTAMILLLALAIYDFVAVRFGYMLWMAKKMSDSNTLPAFLIPKSISEWKDSLKEKSVSKLADQEPAERKFSILGGGDIGFPLLLISSVYFSHDFNSAVVVAAFSMVGLVAAFLIQMAFLKGKPMPALPPIAVLCLIGLFIIW
jgi:presenilin-like A22 family membrane protease